MPFYQKHFRASGFGEDVDKVIAAVKDGDPEKAGVDMVCPYIGIYERKEHLISGIRQIAAVRG